MLGSDRGCKKPGRSAVSAESRLASAALARCAPARWIIEARWASALMGAFAGAAPARKAAGLTAARGQAGFFSEAGVCRRATLVAREIVAAGG